MYFPFKNLISTLRQKSPSGSYHYKAEEKYLFPPSSVFQKNLFSSAERGEEMSSAITVKEHILEYPVNPQPGNIIDTRSLLHTTDT